MKVNYKVKAMKVELNHRRTKFVQQYLITQNASSAAKFAGYASASSAVQGARLLADPIVQRIVSEEMTARLEKASITADWVFSRLKAEALDRSENSSHGARVAALAVLVKCMGMIKPEPTPESKVTFIFTGLSAPERPLIEYEP